MTAPAGEAGPFRAELLAGLAGRRASTTRYAVESRTAYLADAARYAVAPAVCEGLVARRERAFLSALAAGRELPVRPTVQELERFAPQWAYLVPADAGVRATLAHHLGAAHRFTAADVPRLRAALGLDDPVVRAAHYRRHGHGLDAVYAAELTRRERWAWVRARWARRIAELPPFWAAFGLTLTEAVGAGALALPIALAAVGPLGALAMVVAVGLLNVLTVVALAEVFTRSGRVRWGGAYLSEVVGEFLGRAGAIVYGIGIVAFWLAAIVVYVVGLSGVLDAATGVPAPVWAAVLLAVVLGYVARGSLDATVASALTVGAVNVVALLVLSGIALLHADPANLLPPPSTGPPAAVFGSAFGVLLLAYFGHTAMAGCARVVLHREPSGRALAAGAGAATATAVGLYGLWVLAVGAAVPSARLTAEPGTALVPLADVAGDAVLAVGAVFAVLALGMAAVHACTGLSLQVREWVGRRSGSRLAGPAAGLVPVVGVFVVAELLLLRGGESFTERLGLLGIVTVPVLAGVLPMLLVTVSRRRGEHVPGTAPRWLGAPPVTAAVGALYLGALLVHGLVVGDGAAARLLALGVAGVAAGLVVVAVTGGRLRAAVVVEARRDRELGTVHLAVTAGGIPYPATVTLRGRDGVAEPVVVPDEGLELPAGAAAVTVALGGVGAVPLALRLHEVDPGGGSAPLAAAARLVVDDGDPQVLTPRDGRAEARLTGLSAELELVLGEVAR